MLRLQFVSGSLAGTRLNLEPPGALVGRDESACRLVLEDLNVSKRHAYLSCDDGVTWRLQDLQSRNGTVLDGVELNGEAVALREAGELSFADVRVRYQVGQAEVSALPAQEEMGAPAGLVHEIEAIPGVEEESSEDESAWIEDNFDDIAGLFPEGGALERDEAMDPFQEPSAPAEYLPTIEAPEGSSLAQLEALQRENALLRAALAAEKQETARLRGALIQDPSGRQQHEEVRLSGPNAGQNGLAFSLIDQSLSYLERFGQNLETLANAVSAAGLEALLARLDETSISLAELRLFLEDGRQRLKSGLK